MPSTMICSLLAAVGCIALVMNFGEKRTDLCLLLRFQLIGDLDTDVVDSRNTGIHYLPIGKGYGCN